MALFALAVQVVLCFSHIDACELGLVAAKAAPAASADASGPAAPGKGSPIKKSDRTDPTCPICALIQLASTSPPATAPTLPPCTSFVRIRPQTPDAVSFAASPHFSFQARAPPAA